MFTRRQLPRVQLVPVDPRQHVPLSGSHQTNGGNCHENPNPLSLLQHPGGVCSSLLVRKPTSPTLDLPPPPRTSEGLRLSEMPTAQMEVVRQRLLRPGQEAHTRKTEIPSFEVSHCSSGVKESVTRHITRGAVGANRLSYKSL